MATTKKTAVRKAAAKKAPSTTKKSAATPRKTAAVKAPPKPKAVKPEVESDDAPIWLAAVRAAESKKAIDVSVLDLREVTSFADFFVICSGTSSRQVQTIAEEIDVEMRKTGYNAASLEGFKNGEWILADYGDMIVHVFSPSARAFYDLERLWRHAAKVEIPKE